MAVNSRNKEIWKPIKNYEGLYEVSNLGRVKSCRRGKIMSQTKKPNGYLKINLVKDKVWKTMSVHRIVAECFVDNPSGKPFVNHIDFIRSNNNYNNLEWVTHEENVQYSAQNNRYGNTRLNGESNGRALFTNGEVKKIRMELNSNSVSEIAERYNVRYNVIREIKIGKTYADK